MKQKLEGKPKKELQFFPNREIEFSEEKFQELIDDEEGLTIRLDEEDQPKKQKLDLRIDMTKIKNGLLKDPKN